MTKPAKMDPTTPNHKRIDILVSIWSIGVDGCAKLDKNCSEALAVNDVMLH